jgi:membrane protease YdiL (CAAX protease family)
MSSSETSIFQLPPGLKMAVFIGLSGISLILGGMISFSIAAALLHIPFSGLQSALLLPQNASIAQFANALASIIAFGLPGIVVALFSKNTLVSELGFARIKNWNQIGLVVLIAITGLFLSGALGDLTEKIPIPIALRNWATQMEGHFSYFGFLSRMSLGIILGIIYFYTKTIWLPMLMHFINNGIGITILYFVRDNPKKMDAVIDGNLPYYWVVLALLVIIILCKKLKETTHHVELEKSI